MYKGGDFFQIALKKRGWYENKAGDYDDEQDRMGIRTGGPGRGLCDG
jgi:hypothetical protein